MIRDGLPRPPDWHEKALCREHPDPDLWCYEVGYKYEDERALQALRVIEALEICGDCPVRNQCLQQGLELENIHPGTIWGGLLTSERIAILKDPSLHSYKGENFLAARVRKVIPLGAR